MMRQLSSKTRNLLPILLIVVSHFAVVTQAWGTLGHEIVGNLAWYRLGDEAKAWVNGTLAPIHEHHGGDDEDPTMTPLGSVADWADQVRHYLGWSSPLHFIDVRDDLIPGGCLEASNDCQFQYERDCVADECVAGAILNYTKQLLGSKQSSDEVESLRGRGGGAGLKASSRFEKGYNLTQALMFLTHFIGDIHQPLHASRRSDKGGNDFHVRFDLPDSVQSDDEEEDRQSVYRQRNASILRKSHHHHSWNLHSVWDTAIIEVVLGRNYNHSRHVMEQDLFHYSSLRESTVLRDAISSSSSSPCNIGLNATCVIAWGKESFDLALLYAYVESDNVTQVSTGSTLDELYYESRLPIVKQQLILGGIRLAETIEAIVATVSAATSTTTTTTTTTNQKQTDNESMFGASSKLFEVWKTLGLAATLR